MATVGWTLGFSNARRLQMIDYAVIIAQGLRTANFHSWEPNLRKEWK